ncbi:MAG: urea carboxylase-associated family protein [Desulfobacterales bacterium]|nr:MAG: urea carboxylase-associated family protein [Desulfobacterales bacterium]
MTGEQTHGAVRLTVPGGYGRSIDVAKGQYVAVRDIEGGQCGDFWALDAGDFDHFLSPSHTWVHIGRIQPRVGDELVTNRREPILTISADDVGWHDMLVPACDRQRYAKYYGVTEHRSCHDNFLEAMNQRNWGKRPVPQPFNLFMNTFVEPDGTMHIRDSISKAGDIILMIAKMSIIVVVSACPMDLNPVGGQGITDLEIIVGDTEEEVLASIK